MAIDVDDLRLLIDIVECGSFSQAAARRRWSQPQVSQRVAAIEEEAGAPLFYRHRRGASPTAACEAFLPSARLALDALEQGLQAMRGAPRIRTITLASIPSLAPIIFGPALLGLADAAFEIRCTTDHSPQIMELLLTGRAQIGFVLKCPSVAGIQMETLCLSPIIAVAHPCHELASRSALTLADVANARLAPQFWGPDCEALIAQIRSQRTVASPIHTIQPSSAAIELATEHGFITFMPEMAVTKHLADERLVKLDIVDLPASQWEVMVAWRSGKRADAANQVVLDVVRTIAAEWTD